MLKKNWKSQNAETVRTKWIETFGTKRHKPIICSREKFNAPGTIFNVPQTDGPKRVGTEKVLLKHLSTALKSPSEEHL